MVFPLTAYIEAGLELASYEKLDDGSYAGEIPKLKVLLLWQNTARL
jgi:hypothetical protein